MVIALLALIASTWVSASPDTADPSHEQVVAFARLYGVVRYFYPGDAAQGIDWNRFAIAGITDARQAHGRADLQGKLSALFGPLGPGIDIVADTATFPALPVETAKQPLVAWRYLGFPARDPAYGRERTSRKTTHPSVGITANPHDELGERALFDAPPTAGKAAEFPLGDGLKARVALTLTDAQARPSPDRDSALAALKGRLAALPDSKSGITSSALREADIVVAWNVFRHFYPYWDVIHVDWDDALPRALADADKADSRASQKRVLQRLLAPLEDAHGTVIDATVKKSASLPITLEPVEHQWVVIATTVPDQARVGDVVTSIDGITMPQVRERAEALASGQPSTLPWKALQGLQRGPEPESHAFGLTHADGSTSTVSLAYTGPMRPPTARLASIAELKPGTWYVDLARTDLALFSANLAQLASAHTVIYDMRGYPKDPKVDIVLLAHLLDHAENAKWMHIPRYVGPFGELAGYTDEGWNIQPAIPHFTSRTIFLVNGGTMSQAESIMGYVQDEKLGTIVGATTAGVNGDITSFSVPLGFRVVFTGMKVTHHDGVSRYHALGTTPDVAVSPTIAGIRAGRDEVLEAALKLAK